MSIAQEARASSIGTVALSVAGDLRAVTEGRIEGLADADADILHRVMGAGVQVAAGAHLEIEVAMAGHQVEHVIEEADPVSRVPRPSPSRASVTWT